MANYHIAARAGFKEMETAVGHRVRRLNQKMSAHLRRSAMALGIKQNTKEGGRLEFYSVDQQGFDMLTNGEQKVLAILKGANNVRPLAYLDSDAMGKAIDNVNSRYSSRMDRATYAKYERELQRAIDGLLVKLEDDVKAERPKQPKLAKNPYKVGDYFSANWEYSAPKEFANYSNTRVARVSDAYVWLECIRFTEESGVKGVWSNTDSVKKVFPNAKTYGKASQWEDHGHFIPLKGNELMLEWVPVKDYKGRLVRVRWDKVAGYRVKHLGQTAEAGYCYSTRPSD